MSDRGLAITGMGAVTALGADLATLVEAWLAGQDALGPVRRFDASGLGAAVAAEVPDAAVPGCAADGVRGAALLERAADEALGQAALPADARPFVLAAGTKGFLGSGEQVAARHPNHDLALPRRHLGAYLARHHGMAAPVGGTTVSTACASGTLALGLALAYRQRLVSGEADAIVCAGVDLVSDFVYRGFCALGAVDPQGCRPFDRRRAGMTPGEGAGVLVLELPGRARARGVPILGTLRGFGMSCDASQRLAPDPHGGGMTRALDAALRDAGVRPAEVGHIHAHGTATRANDAMEAVALPRVFGAEVVVTGLKGAIGHTFGASGLIETAASIAALARDLVPPVPRLEEPEPGLDLVIGGARRCRTRTFVKSSAGFGGLNAALVLEGPGS